MGTRPRAIYLVLKEKNALSLAVLFCGIYMQRPDKEVGAWINDFGECTSQAARSKHA